MELEDVDKSDVTVTLIQPTAVDTPYPEHARNYMPNEPKLPQPAGFINDFADVIDAATKRRLKTILANLQQRTNIELVVGKHRDRDPLIEAVIAGFHRERTRGALGNDAAAQVIR